MKKYKEYNQPNFAAINEEMLAQWEREQLFSKTLELRTGAPRYVFYDGPPSANGMPGIHHVVARSLKDIFCRFKTMKGYYVERKAGWDTHGLPVELGVEKALGITKEDIGKTISVAEYNQECRKAVMRYTQEWEQLTKMMGYWVDMEQPYITYSTKYIETLWWLLADFYKKGYLYKGFTIQPYSPAAGTGLSSHELNLPGCYRDVKDTVCTAQFKIKDPKDEWTRHGTPYFLAWTTTPWTLPSNTALCVGPKIEYVAVESFNPYTKLPITVVLATSRLSAYFAAEAETTDALPTSLPEETKHLPWRKIGSYTGSELAGLSYEQLLPWITPDGNAFKVITGDFVTTEDGTGIVHIAPTFGADDRMVALKHGIAPLIVIDKDGNERPLVDLQGRFFPIAELASSFVSQSVNTDAYAPFAGKYVKKEYDSESTPQQEPLDVEIAVMLKGEGKAFRIEKHVHNYPHCWRTDKPILYYPLNSWFIKSTAVREQMIALNATIHWKPDAIGSGRFGKWLENLQDWNLSRSRFWGTPLNIWRTEDGSEEVCIASLEELCKEIEKSIATGFMSKHPFADFVPGDMSEENYAKVDLHRPVVDEIVLVSDKGKPMYRENDLIDVWFDSGAMPFAQEHYPFENKERVESGDSFPADFIAEGVDQTRGWFYTLHAIATMAKSSVAFKNVLVNGLVQDKNGNKMSKRLGNAVDPFETIRRYGSDPLRWYLITNAQPWDNVKFDAEGIQEVTRKFFGTLYNTYQFFALYANLDGFDASAQLLPNEERPEIDRWIRSKLHTLILEVTQALEDYEPTRAARRIDEFLAQQLSNWYVRLSRRRFWGGEMNNDKLAAYQTLYECLVVIAQLIAPLAPFYSDRLYRDLIDEATSVHMVDYPKADTSLINTALETNMERAQIVSSLVLALRRAANIKVRYPLAKIMLPVADEQEKESYQSVSHWILSEVNVKGIDYVDVNAPVWKHDIKPDFRALGPRFGKIMKPLAEAIKKLSENDIITLDREGKLTLDIAGEKCEVLRSDVDITVQDIPGWQVATEGAITVALDITLTKDLRTEGLAREMVNRIQNLRKQLGFNVSDRIDLSLLKGTEMDDAAEQYTAYICEQTQADSLALADHLEDGHRLEIDEFTIQVAIHKH